MAAAEMLMIASTKLFSVRREFFLSRTFAYSEKPEHNAVGDDRKHPHDAVFEELRLIGAHWHGKGQNFSVEHGEKKILVRQGRQEFLWNFRSGSIFPFVLMSTTLLDSRSFPISVRRTVPRINFRSREELTTLLNSNNGVMSARRLMVGECGKVSKRNGS